MGLGEMKLDEMRLGEMRFGEMLPNRHDTTEGHVSCAMEHGLTVCCQWSYCSLSWSLYSVHSVSGCWLHRSTSAWYLNMSRAATVQCYSRTLEVLYRLIWPGQLKPRLPRATVCSIST